MLLAPVKHKEYIRFLYSKGGDYPITFHPFTKKKRVREREREKKNRPLQKRQRHQNIRETSRKESAELEGDGG